jgi:hypothetical protein
MEGYIHSIYDFQNLEKVTAIQGTAKCKGKFHPRIGREGPERV